MARYDVFKVVVVHAGDRTTEIPLDLVTAPELNVLQRIHGSDSVLDIQKVGATKERSPQSERERLSRRYGQAVIDALWPGQRASLPVTFEDTGIDPVFTDVRRRRVVASVEPADDLISPADIVLEILIEDADGNVIQPDAGTPGTGTPEGSNGARNNARGARNATAA